MSWGIERWSDEEELWGPTEEPRHSTERGAPIRCRGLLVEIGLPHRPIGIEDHAEDDDRCDA